MPSVAMEVTQPEPEPEPDRFSWVITICTSDNDPRDRCYAKHVAIDPLAREYCVLTKGFMTYNQAGERTRVKGDYPIVTFSEEEWGVMESIAATSSDLVIRRRQSRPPSADDSGSPEFDRLTSDQQRIVAFANHCGGVYWWRDAGDDAPLGARPSVYSQAWMQRSFEELMNNRRIAYVSIKFDRA